MVKAIIFDYYGVLLEDALNATISDVAEYDPDRAQRIAEIIENTSTTRIGVQYAQTQIANLLEISPEEYAHRLRSGQVKNMRLLEYIKELRRTYKIGILTNMAKDELPGIFTPAELEECFDEIVLSGDTGFAKPQIEAYQIAADTLGLQPEECLMIDDLEVCCKGAQQAGMQAITYVYFDQMKRELAALI